MAEVSSLQWTCERCTLLNFSASSLCEACGNAKPKFENQKRLRIGLTYTRDVGKRQIAFVGERPSDLEEVANVAVLKNINNGREFDCSLKTHGFELLQCRTKICKKEFYEKSDAWIREHYYAEIQDLIKRATGASKVIPFHHLVRHSGDPGKPGPASVAHCDYSRRIALTQFDDMASNDCRQGRYIVINAWRNISETQIGNHHLACLNASTVTAPDDFVTFDLQLENGDITEQYRLDPGHHEYHQWFYFPGMKRDEVLLFMQYDSNSRSRARYTFHTSIEVPGVQSTPRESIELRCIAFFPDFQPNTIPAFIFKADELVNLIVDRILKSLNYASHWDENGKNWAKKSLRREGGWRHMVREQVYGGRERKEHGLDRADDTQCVRIVERLLDPQTGYEELARANFLPREAKQCNYLSDDTFCVNAANKIVHNLQYAKHWDAGGKSWAGKCLIRRSDTGWEDMVIEMVYGGRERKQDDLDKASDIQCATIVRILLQPDTRFKQQANMHFLPLL